MELFTVLIAEDGTVSVNFAPQLLELATKEELLNLMDGKMGGLLPIAETLIKFVMSKS